MGPILVFDKSFLESLTLDESVWLDNFFLSNITPIFYVETLADLEKQDKKGKTFRTSEKLVEEIVKKTPILESCPNVHHQRLVIGDLMGHSVEMSEHHRPIISGGDYVVASDGSIYIDFKQFPESSALERWKRHEFREVEQQVASEWRQALTKPNFDFYISLVKRDIPEGIKFSNMENVKTYVDKVVESKYHQFIYLALDALDIPEKFRRDIRERWSKTRPLPFNEFAPYAAYVLSLNIFFYLCLDKSFISKERPSNLVDLSYLYYLPFCMVFVSSDNLHKRVVPLFIGGEQTFIEGNKLKEDLKRLNDYYSTLPQNVKAQGTMKFATYPPYDQKTLIGELFDKHLKPWRNNAKENMANLFKPLDPDKKLIKQLKERQKNQRPYEGPPISSDQAKGMTIKRRVLVQRGSWRILPEGIENKQKSDS